MSYEEIESYTSHAGVMAGRAADNISVIQGLLWEIKVRYGDNPGRSMVEKTDRLIATACGELQKALDGLARVKEEMKQYRQ